MDLKSTTTESSGRFAHLDKMSVSEIITSINEEDKSVAFAIEKELEPISNLVEAVVEKMSAGGRLFYIGAGTSGRLGIVDASECPPTYGVPHGWVVGIIAGGDTAIRKAVEFAEDDTQQGWSDLCEKNISDKDVVIGISASGRTPYVVGALEECRKNNILTGSISCNKNSEAAKHSDFAIEVEVGPEVVTGSTRMKAGTAQKLILNMISSAAMIKLGRVIGNKMVDMQLSNNKLIDRGTRMIMEELNIDYNLARELLLKHGSVRSAIGSTANGF